MCVCLRVAQLWLMLVCACCVGAVSVARTKWGVARARAHIRTHAHVTPFCGAASSHPLCMMYDNTAVLTCPARRSLCCVAAAVHVGGAFPSFQFVRPAVCAACQVCCSGRRLLACALCWTSATMRSCRAGSSVCDARSHPPAPCPGQRFWTPAPPLRCCDLARGIV
jgi:hypothetical protein